MSKTLVDRKITNKTRCGITETATTPNFMLWLFLNNRNALWHVKICHDANFVSWLLTEMTTAGSEVEDVEVTVKTEGFGLKVTCNLCVRESRINIKREGAKSGQGQAQKMVSLCNSRLQAVDNGTNVVVRAHDLDRGRLAPRNVPAVVVGVNSFWLCLLVKKEGLLSDCILAMNLYLLATSSRHVMCPQVHYLFGQPQ